MDHIEIPTQLFWENGNSWYGSLGNARFFIKPEAPEGLISPSSPSNSGGGRWL